MNRLIYFPIPGRAEPIRIALSLSDLEWEDIQIDGNEYYKMKKSHNNHLKGKEKNPKSKEKDQNLRVISSTSMVRTLQKRVRKLRVKNRWNCKRIS